MEQCGYRLIDGYSRIIYLVTNLISSYNANDYATKLGMFGSYLSTVPKLIHIRKALKFRNLNLLLKYVPNFLANLECRTMTSGMSQNGIFVPYFETCYPDVSY